VTKPKPSPIAQKPPVPKRPPVTPTRSRVVAVPKVTLPEASKGPSKFLGDPEDIGPVKPPPPKKAAEH